MRIEDPVRSECWEHSLQMTQAILHDLFVGPPIEVVRLRQVAREVHQSSAGVTLGRLEVGMLDDADKRKTGIVYVEPVRSERLRSSSSTMQMFARYLIRRRDLMYCRPA